MRTIEDLTETAIKRIQAFAPKEEPYYLAFSGGKDSVVLKRLAEMANVKFECFYNVTTVDPPEVIHFMRKHHPDVVFNYPKESMYRLCIRKNLLPTRIARFCCLALKESGGENRTVLTGVRAAESSRRREQARLVRPCTAKNRVMVNPILDWTDADVWRFIKLHRIPYCTLYDEGIERIGCIGCPMAGPAQMVKEFQRWPGFLRIYYRAAEKILPKILVRTEEKRRQPSIHTVKEFLLWWLRDTTLTRKHAKILATLIDDIEGNRRKFKEGPFTK